MKLQDESDKGLLFAVDKKTILMFYIKNKKI